MILTALLLAATPAAAADRVLSCRLTTPGAHEIAFEARLGTLTGVLEPAPGAAWPTRRVIGPGAWRDKKEGFEARYHFAGTPTGIDFKVEGERATLFVGKRLRSGQPRALGFCLPAAAAPAMRADAPVSPSAGANVPAFDSARWPQTCGLVTRSGRRAPIDYKLVEGGGRAAMRSPGSELLSPKGVAVGRVEGGPGGFSRFGGKEGPAGKERLEMDEKTGEGVKIVLFDRIGADAGPSEPAAAICGYTGLIRAPAPQ